LSKKQNYSFEQNIQEILISIGEDINREGLVDTPKRVNKAYKEIFDGYNINEKELLQSAMFSTDNENMVIVDNIDFFSMCEHHMLPIIGKAYIAYIPNKKVVGLSKIPRLVEVYARRLQIQENMTEQIAIALMENIQPKGVAVILKARHLCMEMRGVNKINSLTTTHSYKGVFNSQSTIKQEFLSQIN
jgi:GTP cyclohydrolase I